MTTQINIIEDERNTTYVFETVDLCTIELPCGKYRVRRLVKNGHIFSVEVERQRKNGKTVWANLCSHAHRHRFALAAHFATTKVWA